MMLQFFNGARVLVYMNANGTLWVDEVCPCGGFVGWVGPKRDEVLTCEDCDEVLTKLSRGIALSSLNLRSDQDDQLLRSRLINRLEEMDLDVLTVGLAEYEFFDHLRGLARNEDTVSTYWLKIEA